MARVLVIEQNEELRNLVTRRLTHNGHETLASQSLAQGMQALNHEDQPELIALGRSVLDIYPDACRILREVSHNDGLPILFIDDDLLSYVSAPSEGDRAGDFTTAGLSSH